MSGVALVVIIFIAFAVGLAIVAFVSYRHVLRKAKGIERGLKMVPLLIHLPPPSDDTDGGNRDTREVLREKVSQAEALYELIAGTAKAGFKSNFYGQRHIAFEIISSNGLVHYFAAVPVTMVDIVEQAIVTAYPGARLEEVEDHNIFNPQGRLTGTVGGELVLRHEAAYPIATIDTMERDPMSGLINALYKLQLGDGAAVQIMLRPASPKWSKKAEKIVANKRHQRQGGLGFSAGDIAKATVKTSEEWRENSAKYEPSKHEEEMLQGIESKIKHPGFEVLVRILASSSTYDRAHALLQTITNSFALYEAPGSNGFQYIEGRDMQGLVTAFIFRFFPPEVASNVLSSVELATLFHLPDAQFTPTTQVARQQSKQVDGPPTMPADGLLLGYNFYRGTKKEIRLSQGDRRRHTYIVGQTGTGKSTILENLAVQDMLAGNGFAFIDPHGDVAEKLISMVPKERAEDIIYFNPGDMEHPLGLNMFEFSDPNQKDFLIQESLNMLYKIYDPGKTGIIGPRFEQWYRNAALTLMADPNGASFIEIPKVFTDNTYLKDKFKYLTDPTVMDFWTKEMGQTSDYHKSEMLGFFVSKFGAFQQNEMMRNIIGQTKSSFNMRDIMDNKKILIVNLSKGAVGDLNAQLLGMIFVMKFQAAAMSRADMPEEQRNDFCLYVDEFQNFSTDSFASILSEARKYRLNLIVANQFIGQLTDEIRDAVFGNVGTMMTYRTGPEDAEFLVKQFEPTFDQRDLVNLPNYNAVMKLLVGGLPSLPFSITALPPLGHANPEMLLAVKQLSAAKFGKPRATVEAEIFARLQNQPKTVMANAATAPIPGSAAPAAPAPATSPANPLAQTDEHAVMLPPKPKPAPLMQDVVAPTPAPAPTPTPAPQPQVNPQPVSADPEALTISQIAQAPAALDVAPTSVNPQPTSISQDGPSIADVVTATPHPEPEPIAEPTDMPLPKPLEIEAQESDGKTVEPPVEIEDRQAEVKPGQPLQIEANEADGRVEVMPTPEPVAQPDPLSVAAMPMPKPAPKVEIAPSKAEPKSAPEPATQPEPVKAAVVSDAYGAAAAPKAEDATPPKEAHAPDSPILVTPEAPLPGEVAMPTKSETPTIIEEVAAEEASEKAAAFENAKPTEQVDPPRRSRSGSRRRKPRSEQSVPAVQSAQASAEPKAAPSPAPDTGEISISADGSVVQPGDIAPDRAPASPIPVAATISNHPEPEASAADLEPGEIRIDAQGNVAQG